MTTIPLEISENLISLSPALIGEGSVATVTIKNVGWETIYFKGIEVTGPFSVDTSTFLDLLKPDEKCTLSFTFVPLAAGIHTGTLVLDLGDDVTVVRPIAGIGVTDNLDGTDLAGIVIVETKALLDTIYYLSYPNGSYAFVVSDPDPTLNGIYRKTGGVGVGNWVLAGIFEQALAEAIEASLAAQASAEAADISAVDAANSAASIADIPPSVAAPLATDIPGITVHPLFQLIQVGGYSAYGQGVAKFINDAVADAALMAAHPLAVKQDMGGRYFRLLPDEDGLIAVEAMGVIGTVTVDHTTNHQPGIQAALDYAHAIGANGIKFTAKNYSIWTPLRTPTSTGAEINTDFTGRPIIINGSKVIEAAPGGTTLWRRTNNGSDPATFANVQVIDTNNTTGTTNGVHWRGGMIFMKGQGTSDPGTRPADYASLANLTLRGDLTLKGGLPISATPGVVNGDNYKQLNADGSGWDITDKPIWFENDRHTGDLMLDGNITIDGFRGELIYQGGLLHGSIVQMSGRLALSNTDADGLNPGPVYNRDGRYGRVIINDILITNCYQPMEGWLGDQGFLRGTIVDCAGISTMQGGKAGAGTYSTYYAPTRFTATQAPMCGLDLTFRDCGNFLVGSYLTGSIRAIDTKIKIGDATAYEDGVVDTHLDFVEVLADKEDIDVAIAIQPGNAAGSQLTKDVSIALARVGRTAYGRANGFEVSNPFAINNGGSYGPGIFVNRLEYDSTLAPQSPGTTAMPAYRIVFRDLIRLSGNASSMLNANHEANVETTPNLTPKGPVLKLQKTNVGNHQFTLQTANAQAGERVTLVNISGTTTTFVMATANTREVEPIAIYNGQQLTVEFDGSLWVVVQPPGRIALSATLDPASIAANSLSDVQTITAVGARPGMSVVVFPHVDWVAQGLAVVNARVSAIDTIQFQLMNATAAAVDPASKTITGTLGGW